MSSTSVFLLCRLIRFVIRFEESICRMESSLEPFDVASGCTVREIATDVIWFLTIPFLNCSSVDQVLVPKTRSALFATAIEFRGAAETGCHFSGDHH